jgi:hypothetical protein
VDHKNLFLTPATAALLRLEYGVALAACVVLALAHRSQIHWPTFAALFVAIDVIGYLPGRLIWTARGGTGVPRACYLLYNVAHSGVTAAAVAGLWCLTLGAEWALLALPIHLLGDRAVFGNFLKPFGLAFEPQPDPAYTDFRRSYAHAARHDPARSTASLG